LDKHARKPKQLQRQPPHHTRHTTPTRARAGLRLSGSSPLKSARVGGWSPRLLLPPPCDTLPREPQFPLPPPLLLPL
jgi:hypothetical protein